MADASQTLTKYKLHVPGTGGVKQVFPAITFAGNYRTGGVALSAANLGLTGIITAQFEPFVGNTAGDDTAVDNIQFFAQYVRSSGKVKIIVASSGVELADNKAIDSSVIYGIVIGY
jgi:hypothetical protein